MADIKGHAGAFNADTSQPITEYWIDNGDGSFSRKLAVVLPSGVVLPVTLATQIEGEDSTYHRMLVAAVYNPFLISTATTTVVKSGPGRIGKIVAAGGTLGAVTIWDNTAASGAALLPSITPVQGQVLLEDIPFGTGLTIVTATAMVIRGGTL